MEDALERIIAIHGDKHLEDQLSFTLELVGACRACMLKAPVWGIVSQRNVHMFQDFLAYGQVEVIRNRELLAKVGTE